MRERTLVVSVGLLGFLLTADDVYGFHLGVIHLNRRKKVSSNTKDAVGPQKANIQLISPTKIRDAKISIRKRSSPNPLKVRHRRRNRVQSVVLVERTVQKSFLPPVSLDVAEVDPWGVKYE